MVAYELLCDMEAEEGREYDIVPNPYAKESEGPASEIIVWCFDLEGCNWQKALGAEMNFCPEAELVPLDMIACIPYIFLICRKDTKKGCKEQRILED